MKLGRLMEIPKEIETEWSKYTQLKDSGLRKQANQVMLSVVKTIESQGLAEFKDFLYALCEDGFSADYEKKIPHPIFLRCILPLLVEGFTSKSVDELVLIVKSNRRGFGREIYGAIGEVSNRALLKVALEIDPNNPVVINLLAEEYIEALYYGAHHLPDGLIVELEYANSVINESSEFIDRYKGAIDPKYITSHQYYVQLYDDYQVWKMGGFLYDFREWCEKNKKSYQWVKSYYYD